MKTFRAIMIERDSRETVQCKRFTDIPFDHWSKSKGTLTLEFPDIGYQSNFSIRPGQIGHIIAHKQWRTFKASALEELFCELPTRVAAWMLYNGYSIEIANGVESQFSKRQEILLEQYGSPKETGWGGILATLAGAGLLAIATSMKKPRAVQVEQVTEQVEEVMEISG